MIYFKCVIVTAAALILSNSGQAEASQPLRSLGDRTPYESALTYPSSNCGGATVRTPRPNEQFADWMNSAPQTLSIYQKAALYDAKWLSSISCSRTGISHKLDRSPASNTSPPIAGNAIYYPVVQDSAWSAFNIGNQGLYVQASYVVPDAGPPGYPLYSGSGIYRASIWAGLGGGYSGVGSTAGLPLVQSGTTVVWESPQMPSYYFWVELIGLPGVYSGEMVINELPAHPGDNVEVSTRWIHPEKKYVVSVCNYSVDPQSAQCAELEFQDPSFPPPGSSIEWVVEAPSIGLGNWPIANYTAVSMTDACWVPAVRTNRQCLPLTHSSVFSPQLIELWQFLLGHTQRVSHVNSVTANGIEFRFTHPEPIPQGK